MTDPRTRAAYAEGAGIYRIVPRGVMLPGSLADLREAIVWTTAEGVGLVPRGAGSGIPGNTVGDDYILDLRERMPLRLELDAASRTVITSANVTRAQLSEAIRPHGLRLPPDPSSGKWATLGGMVSTNAAGSHTVRYGPVRRWVRGLEVMTADAETTWLRRTAVGRGDPHRRAGSQPSSAQSRFQQDVCPEILGKSQLIGQKFPRTTKNTAGYALDQWLASGDDLDLWIGGEGTLGVITAIEWQLDPIPPARTGLRVSLRSLDDLEPAVSALVRLEPSAVELLDRTFLDLVGRQGATEAMLLVEFERETATAARGVVGDAVRALGDLAAEVVTALTPEEEHDLWQLRHAASPILAGLTDRRSMQVIEDGCVPLARLGDYIRAVRQAAQDADLTAVIFGHAGDGHVHVNLLPELQRSDWPNRVAGVYRAVTAEVIRLGGTFSGEHGDGRLRTPLLEALYGPEIVALFRQTKTAWDPRGIFNPGVKVGSAGDPLDQLKVGPAAAPIPEDIALALREIERTGGYARSRMQIAQSTHDRTP
ncbi:MAG TPA: FAD-binding oxidoreductase [Gemmatimonadales bacterium]|nr:FAD-binding oxidoreductase [Gemmatimonadales bacterium]